MNKINERKNKERNYTFLSETRLGDTSLYYLCGMVVDATNPCYMESMKTFVCRIRMVDSSLNGRNHPVIKKD